MNNKNGDDFIVIFVFKSDVDIEQSVKKGIRKEDLLIDPEIVGKEYWTRGYFFNVGHIESKVNNYGFYSIGKRKFLMNMVMIYRRNLLYWEHTVLQRFQVLPIVLIKN